MDSLPRITPGVAASVRREIMEDDNYFLALLSRLEEADPSLAEILGGFALEQTEEAAAMAAGLLVYRLLELQAEVDHLEREFRSE